MSEFATDATISALQQIFEAYGYEVFTNHAQFRAALLDYLPTLDLERNILRQVVDARISDQLYQARESSLSDKAIVASTATHTLVTNFGLSTESSNFAIHTICQALGWQTTSIHPTNSHSIPATSLQTDEPHHTSDTKQLTTKNHSNTSFDERLARRPPSEPSRPPSEPSDGAFLDRWLYRRVPSDDHATDLAQTLVGLALRHNDANETRQIIDEIRDLYRQHTTPAVACQLSRALVGLTNQRNDAIETRQIIDEIRDLYRQHSTTRDISRLMSEAMISLTSEDGVDLHEYHQIADEMRSIYHRYPTSDHALQLSKVLGNQAIQLHDANEIRQIIDEVNRLFQSYPTPNHASVLARALVGSISQNNNPDDLLRITSEVRDLYQSYGTPDIARSMAISLVLRIMRTNGLSNEDKNQIADEVFTLDQHYPNADIAPWVERLRQWGVSQ